MIKIKYNLTITHLYPNYMNIYGDIGNIITLKKRCEWRNINVRIKNISMNDKLPNDTNIYFIGGGQDKDQEEVSKDLLYKKEKLTSQIENGVCLLSVCGGYQLLGKYFLSGDGIRMNGLEIFNIETKASSNDIKMRCIGNVVAVMETRGLNDIKEEPNTIVGFENHSGQTYLGTDSTPLAYVLKGYGNNIEDNTEGCVYKNAIGTYLHGSFLPKNPHVADWLIIKALKLKYGNDIDLINLDDNEELEAHKIAEKL